MNIDPMHDYRAYLFAREAAEDFLLAYAKANSPGEMTSFYRERGAEELSKLAAHLGFELVPVAQSVDPSNIIQIVPEPAIGASA